MRARLKVFLAFSTMIVSLSICWSAAFFITQFFYKLFHIHFNEYLIQLFNSIFGFFIFGCCLFLFSKFFPKQRQKQAEFVQSIIDAMRQIARGDYQITLKKLPGHDHPEDPYSKIVDNINYMSKELGQMEQMRQEFVSNVSHEIQSPLTSISGFARSLKNETLTQKERWHYLSIIETESERLSKLSDNLLKLTYLESAQHSFELQEYRLDKQLQHALLSCEPQWSEKQMEMEISLKKTWITADKDLLDQVWMNLLHNAIKFTSIGGTIRIATFRRKEELIVEISDTGIGIAEEDQLHLFERFYKADKARSRETGGSGLGLSIVKKIIDMHKGIINVASKPNQGTTFTITFSDSSTNR
ncbi:HAMP domain-containing sensor histidine kinase [Lederbergia sp. NSJ-179]|uniref:sensor histidine kinase n=1 Tax=Lederbergia sp. NSJ-179 TaxID=2931402 RepID=UPI0028BF4084|nr:HAMP domain-containing sensor histidine kinase [Lederbergia sp. NSJ-179]